MTGLRLGLSITQRLIDAVVADTDSSIVRSVTVERDGALKRSLDDILDAVGGELLTSVSTVAVASTLLSDQLRSNTALQRVGILRIGMTTTAIPPLSGWPRELAESIAGPQRIVRGGNELDGAPLDTLDTAAIREFAGQCAGQVAAIAVTAVFSPVAPQVESEAVAILSEELDQTTRIIPSHLIGGFGLLERENATILNAALAAAGHELIDELSRALQRHDCGAELFLAQNDGNLLSADTSRLMPVRLLDSRLATSVRGAGLVTGHADALVVDSIDGRERAGVLRGGEVALEHGVSSIGGVRMLHWLPIGFDDGGQPVSRLRRYAGTDELLDLGSAPTDSRLRYASALAVATAPVSASVWAIVSGPDSSLSLTRQRAIDEAILAGADPNETRIVSVVETPLSYMPEGRRVFLRAAGPPFVSTFDNPQ